MNEENDTFVSITNKDIYDEIKKFQAKNLLDQIEIIKRLDITNGRVKLARWIASTALAIGLIAIGYLIDHISN